MTPQLQQAIRLLQLPIMDLQTQSLTLYDLARPDQPAMRLRSVTREPLVLALLGYLETAGTRAAAP